MSTIDRYESTFVVSLDPSQGDFTSLQPAINALPASGGKIFVKAGVYQLTNTIQIKAGNVQIQGEGMGITVLVGDSTMTGDTPGLEVFSTVDDGVPRSLIADTARGDSSIQMSAMDASSFAPGDYVLLYSNKSVDTEDTAKHAGELKQIVTVDPVTGVIGMDDQIFDAYTLADSAQVVRVTVLRNITLSDFSITTQAQSSTLRRGFTHFRFVENLTIERVEVHDVYFTGIHLQSVRNSVISGCYIHHINDIVPVNPPHPANARYGIVAGCAAQNVTISGCRFSHTRHAVTTGGSSGKNSNGVQRNIIVANCTSMLSDTAHFDTHQPAESVTFTGCMAIGGMPVGGFPATNVVVGFQMRGRNCSIVGCSVLQAIGKGIMIFGPASSGAVISGNMIANVKAVQDTQGRSVEGVGIFLDSQGTSGHSITGNVIKNCEGSALVGAGDNNDVVVSGNVIDTTNLAIASASISLHNAERITICGNKIVNNQTGQPIEMAGGSKQWHIADNFFAQNNSDTPAPLSIDAIVINNPGYNPIGIIATPWQPSGDLTNEAGGSPDPTSGKSYTVRQTPKTVIVTGGNATQIAIDGTPTGVLSGAFKLGIGETIAVTYSSAPTTKVWAD